MSKEIKEILDELESLFEISEAPEHIINGFNKLKDYITNLQQKVEQLEKENEKLKQENKRIFQNVNDDELLISNAMNYAEVQRLNNIINELEKILTEEYDYCDKHIDPAFGTGMGVAKRTLDKLKDLKDSD